MSKGLAPVRSNPMGSVAGGGGLTDAIVFQVTCADMPSMYGDLMNATLAFGWDGKCQQRGENRLSDDANVAPGVSAYSIRGYVPDGMGRFFNTVAVCALVQFLNSFSAIQKKTFSFPPQPKTQRVVRTRSRALAAGQ